MIRLGFLGTGWIGRHRMAAMLATGAVEAACVCDPDPACLAEARALAPQAEVTASLEAMLAMPLDGIVIATPSALHADQAIRALQAGVAVFCQKPLGRSAAEVQAVVDAARAADRLLGLDLSYRHIAGVDEIAAAVRRGDFGRIFAADLVFHNAYGPGKDWFYDPVRSGGGCVIDLGVHLVDLALWVLDFPAVDRVGAQLRAAGAPLRPGQVEDYAAATFAAGDADVRLACSWKLHAGREAVIEAAFYGTRGGAALRNVAGSFYDFTVDRFDGTTAIPIASPPDDWGGRAASAWATRLSRSNRYDEMAGQFVASAQLLDTIYAQGCAAPIRSLDPAVPAMAT